jgi:diguanylate cyclase (GGDEF)-like protein
MNRGRQQEEKDGAIRHAERLLAAARGTVTVEEYGELLRRYRRLLSRFAKVMVISDSYDAQLKTATEQLEQLRALSLPICMFCKKIRVDEDYWEQVEGYFSRHIDVAFTHGICPTCMEERYGEIADTPQGRIRIAEDVHARAQKGSGRVPDEDEAVRAAQALLDAPETGAGALRSGLRKLAERYRRLLRRMGKILLISDGYQARLMDLNVRLNLLAHTDGLTGLSNRHAGMERLEAERSRAERHGQPFSLAIADVDDFKAINDTHGHEAGDVMLRELSRMLRGQMRKEDTCARWGGEEFIFLLPETDGAAATALMTKLLAAVRGMQISYRGATLRCTMSAGCASLRPGRGVDDLLREADEGLYRAKREGKDRVSGPRDA